MAQTARLQLWEEAKLLVRYELYHNFISSDQSLDSVVQKVLNFLLDIYGYKGKQRLDTLKDLWVDVSLEAEKIRQRMEEQINEVDRILPII